MYPKQYQMLLATENRPGLISSQEQPPKLNLWKSTGNSFGVYDWTRTSNVLL